MERDDIQRGVNCRRKELLGATLEARHMQVNDEQRKTIVLKLIVYSLVRPT